MKPSNEALRNLSPQDEVVIRARMDLVRKYRAQPGIYPDGIDSKWDRWYQGREEEWDDDGNYSGLLPMPKRPEVVSEAEPVLKPSKSRLKASKKILEQIAKEREPALRSLADK